MSYLHFPLGESYFKASFIILRNNGLNTIIYLFLLMTKYKESKATSKNPNYCQTLHCKSHTYKCVYIHHIMGTAIISGTNVNSYQNLNWY